MMDSVTAAAENRVTAQYAVTRAALSDDPKWVELSKTASEEASSTPDYFFARNMQALYLETKMPAL